MNPNHHHLRNQLRFLIFLPLIAVILLGAFFPALNARAGDGRALSDPYWGAAITDAPGWLDITDDPSRLYSEYEFVALAGRLITYRVVDASECPGGGLLPGGTANDCGLNKAQPAVFDWQNRFNKSIIAASRDVGVPPVLLKNVFAWESQFWPESVFVNTYEYGLGHLTEMGADSALRWNAPFYDSICAKSFHVETCQEPYADQPASIQAALRGVVIQQVNADCPTCAYGLDLPLTERSIPVFAHTLAANATFVKWYVSALTGRPAAEVVTYENLWKFTLTSYNAGPGCFSIAFTRIRNARMNYDWKNLASKLDPACKGAIPYVDFISKTEQYHPGNDPALIPTATPTPTPTSILTEAILTIDFPQETPADASSSTPTEPGPAETGDGTRVEPHEGSPTATPIQGTPGEPTSTAMPDPSQTPSSVTPVASQPAPTTLPADAVQFPHVSNQVVVRLEPQHRETTIQLLKDLGASLVQGGEQFELPDTFIVQIESGTLAEVLATLQESGVVAYAEPNYLVKLAGLPGDPEFPRQSNLWAVQAPQAWNALPSMQEVVVAVLDTGVELTHPDLADSLWLNSGELGLDASGMDRRSNGLDDDGNGYIDDWLGWNMVAGNNMPQDDHGHGTHLSGIIAAVQNNNLGIAGVAPNARILPVKVLDASGFGSYAQVAEGIIYATNMGARIINLGFGGEAHSLLLQEAIDYALARGVIMVAAGGNSGTATTYYPAGYPGVIAVSAVDENLNWAPFSSSGEHISLAAPGLSVFSTWPGSYRVGSGTSMASAHVSGVAALLAGQPLFSDAISIRTALIGGALDRGNPGQDTYFGNGVVQAFGALQYAGPVLPTPTPWAIPAPAPAGSGGVTAFATQDLYGRTQISTYPITDPANSIDGSFNDLVAFSSGPYGGGSVRRWTFTSIDDTTFTSVYKVELDIRFYVSGWVDDSLDIQIYEPTNTACILDGYCIVQILQPDNGVPPAEVQPPSALTTLTFDVTSRLNTVSKVNAAQVRIAGRSTGSNGIADNITIHIDGVRLRIIDSIPPTPAFMPTPTLPPRFPTATPIPGEPHGHIEATTDQCAACHRMHTAQSLELRSGPSEEATCFSCHTTAGSGTNVQPAFTSYLNSLTRFFKHDVANTKGVHVLNESDAARFGGANRHVECEDCHNPHTTSRTASGGSYSAPSIAQEAFNTSGVDPIWEASGAPTGYSFLQTAEREYQLCLKCHSSYTTLPAYRPDGFGWNGSGNGYVANGLFKLDFSSATQLPDSRDLAKEFNPYQASFHPVAAQGRNRNIPAGSFVTGWSQDSMVYCSDCHTNASAPTNGTGPHGSPRLHILSGWADYVTAVDPLKSCSLADDPCEPVNSPGEVCFKCHQYGTYVAATNPGTTTNFRNGVQNLHAFHNFASCYTCHDTHGSEQLRLINFDTSVVNVYPGYNSQSAWEWNSSTGTGTCYLACHSGGHGSGKKYIP